MEWRRSRNGIVTTDWIWFSECPVGPNPASAFSSLKSVCFEPRMHTDGHGSSILLFPLSVFISVHQWLIHFLSHIVEDYHGVSDGGASGIDSSDWLCLFAYK